MSADLDLLRRHVPRLRFDALECLRPVRADDYFAASRVVHEPADHLDPLPEEPVLEDESRTNALLRAFGSEQRVDAQGTCYGRVVRASLWVYLQYWFFYVDNPCVLPPGRHDGDWELVQVRLTKDADRVTHLTYAQHGGPETRRADPGTVQPEVFVAVNSHASYFGPGTQPTFPVADECDAHQAPATELVVVEFPADGWPGFPGRWGADEGPGSWLARHVHLSPTPAPLRWLNRVLPAGDSPPGPSWQKSSWASPARFQASGTRHRLVPVLLRRLVHWVGNLTWPRARPTVAVERDRAGVVVRAEPAGHLLRRVRRAALRLEDAATGAPLATHAVRADGTAHAVPLAHDVEPAWRVAGYNALRQRGNVGERERL